MLTVSFHSSQYVKDFNHSNNLHFELGLTNMLKANQTLTVMKPKDAPLL